MSRISRIDDYLLKGLKASSTAEEVEQASRYLAVLPGGRFRPIVALRSYELLNGQESEFMKAAVGIELVHLASLVVDDSKEFDGADLRKGELPVHLKYGPGVATLSAHHLRGAGEHWIRKCFIERNVSKQYQGLANDLTRLTAENMMKGQIARSMDKTNTDENYLLSVAFHLDNLFYFGPMLAGYLRMSEEDTLLNLGEMGRAFSIGHQLWDDIRDVGEDGKKGRVTLPIVKGVDHTRKVILEMKDIIVDSSRKINERSRMGSLADRVLGIQK